MCTRMSIERRRVLYNQFRSVTTDDRSMLSTLAKSANMYHNFDALGAAFGGAPGALRAPGKGHGQREFPEKSEFGVMLELV